MGDGDEDIEEKEWQEPRMDDVIGQCVHVNNSMQCGQLLILLPLATTI